MRFTEAQLGEANAVRGVLARAPLTGDSPVVHYTVTFEPAWTRYPEVIDLTSPADLMALAVSLDFLDDLDELPNNEARQNFSLGVAEGVIEDGTPIARGNLMIALLMSRGFGFARAEAAPS